MTIKDLPQQERPRERLLEVGAEQMNNEELLAIILENGTVQLTSKEIAGQILRKYQAIHNLRDCNYEQLQKIKGIGKAKACKIMACVELGKRIYQNQSTLKRKKLPNVISVYDYYHHLLENKKQEHFYCIYLDNKNYVIKDKLLFIGTINYSIIHPREIFKEAYMVSATSIICIHNHPSGNPEPSREDKDITSRLTEVGNMMGIRILDHIIIGNHTYYSFLENDCM